MSIRLEDVHKAFGLKEILRGFSLEVHEGETLSIIGASGAGKSVTLKHVLRLIQPDRGEVWVDGQNVAGAYGAGKARCEAVLREAHESGGFPITIVRPTHCLGPDNYNLGWEPSFFARIERGQPILVPGDGTPLVPYVHVDDLARGFATLLGEERAIGKAFNVVGSEAVTLDGLIRLMGSAVSRSM